MIYYYIYTPLISFFINFFLVILVLRSDFKSFINRICALFLLFASFWGLFIYNMRTSTDVGSAILWDKISLSFTPLMSLIFFHLVLEISQIRQLKRILPVAYSVSIILAVLSYTSLLVVDIQLKPLGYTSVYGVLSYFHFTWIFLLTITSLIILIMYYRRSTVIEKKRQAILLIAAVLSSLLGGLIDVFRSFGLQFPPVSIIGNIIFGILVTIAILRYRFLDVSHVVRTGLTYTLVSGIVAAIYVLFITLFKMFFQTYQLSLFMDLIIILFIAMLLQPVLRGMQTVVDKWFYRERYGRLKALEQFSQETKDITNLDYLAKSFIRLVSQAMGSTQSCLMLPDSTGKEYYVVADYGLKIKSFPVLSSNSVIIRWFQEHEGFLIRESFAIIPQLQAMTKKTATALDQLNAELLVPLKSNDKITGILVMGPTRTGETYTDSDKRLLAIASQQLSTSLDNARLYEESQRAYKELELAQDRLVSSERLKALGEMTSGISHDFNNALTTILGGSQLSLNELDKREIDKKKIKRDLNLVEQAALDASQMVRRLQDFARVRTDHDLYTVDLNTVIQSALEMIKPLLDEQSQTTEANIEVITNLGKIGFVEGNESDLRESLVNILINAIQAMPDGGKLMIKSEQSSDLIVISITDTGIGMTQEVRKKIFEPFFTTKGHKGLGMGLSVVFGIINRHKGQIIVESEPGKGTSFKILLPVTEKSQEEVVSELLPKKAKEAKILVIDDSIGPRYVIHKILTEAGYEVDTSSTGKEALTLAQKKNYDLVITDLGMPDISGRQIATEVKAAKPETQIILVTGWGVQLDLEELRQYGVDSILTKPFNQENVLNLVNKMLNGNLT